MHNPESILENETLKFLRGLKIQTDHLISAWRPDLEIIKKQITWQVVDFAIPADHRVKVKES